MSYFAFDKCNLNHVNKKEEGETLQTFPFIPTAERLEDNCPEVSSVNLILKIKLTNKQILKWKGT